MEDRHRDYLIVEIIVLTNAGYDGESIARKLSVQENSRVDIHWVNGIIGYYRTISLIDEFKPAGK